MAPKISLKKTPVDQLIAINFLEINHSRPPFLNAILYNQNVLKTFIAVTCTLITTFKMLYLHCHFYLLFIFVYLYAIFYV